MISDPFENQLIISAPQEVQNRLIGCIGSGNDNILWSDNIFKTTALTFKYVKENQSNSSIVVAVWVDNLSSTQFKFFTLAANTGKVIPIAFSDHNQEKLVLALENGAVRAVLTESICTGFFKSFKNRTNLVEAQSADQDMTLTSAKAGTETKQDNNDCPESLADRMKKLNDEISLSKEELDSLLLDDTQ